MICWVLAAAINWPLGYNHGVTAYRSNDFMTAATAFEQATASVDRTLQERAYYNLGNTNYRLGETDPTKAQALWEQAVKHYKAALALNPKDEDAKFNHEFVKKKLEELKKQQEQQQQQNQKSQDQQKKEQEHKQERPEQSQQNQQQSEQKPPQNNQQQQRPKPEPSQQKEQPQEQQPQQSQAGNLDKQQAKALLDQLRENEQNWNFFPEVQMKDLKDSGEPAKDW
jgi:Ca-activated chloride channel family protein